MDVKELRKLAAKLKGKDREDLERIIDGIEERETAKSGKPGPKSPPPGKEKIRKHINMPLDVAKYYDSLEGSSSAYVVDLIREDMKGRKYTDEALDLLWELTQESLEDQQWESREEWHEAGETLTDLLKLSGPNGLNGAGATNAAAKGDVPALVWLRVEAFGLPPF